MEVLSSLTRKPLAIWRSQLKDFFDEAAHHITTVNPYYTPQLRKFVSTDTWNEIRDTKLRETDRNASYSRKHEAIVEFLCQTGQYQPTKDSNNRPVFAAPHRELERTHWPNPNTVPGLTYVGAFEAFKANWRKIALAIPDSEMPPPKTRAKAILNAIQPPDLLWRVRDRIKSGKEPYPYNPGVQHWRTQAKYDDELLKRLIQENAEQMDEERDLPAVERAQHADPSTGAGGHTPNLTQQCKHFGCTRVPNLIGAGPQRHQYCYAHAPGRSSTTWEPQPSELPMNARSVSLAPPQMMNQSPLLLCRHSGCKRPRHVTRDGRIGPCCSYEHYRLWSQARNSSADPESQHSHGRDTRPDNNNPGPLQAKVCHLCSGNHIVLSCPMITARRKQLMEEHIGYRHTLTWWRQPANQERGRAFRISDYEEPAAPARAQRPTAPRAVPTWSSAAARSQTGPLL